MRVGGRRWGGGCREGSVRGEVLMAMLFDNGMNGIGVVLHW